MASINFKVIGRNPQSSDSLISQNGRQAGALLIWASWLVYIWYISHISCVSYVAYVAYVYHIYLHEKLYVYIYVYISQRIWLFRASMTTNPIIVKMIKHLLNEFTFYRISVLIWPYMLIERKTTTTKIYLDKYIAMFNIIYLSSRWSNLYWLMVKL